MEDNRLRIFELSQQGFCCSQILLMMGLEAQGKEKSRFNSCYGRPLRRRWLFWKELWRLHWGPLPPIHVCRQRHFGRK